MDARAHSEPPRKNSVFSNLLVAFLPEAITSALVLVCLRGACTFAATTTHELSYWPSTVSQVCARTHARDGRMRSTHVCMTPKKAIDHDRDDLFLSFAEFIFYLARRLERPAVEHTSTSAALLKPGDGKSGFFFRLLLSISITNCWALIGRGMYGVCPVVHGDFLANSAGTVVKFYEREIWKNAASFLS